MVKKNKVDEARDTLQATVLSHVPVTPSFILAPCQPRLGKMGLFQARHRGRRPNWGFVYYFYFVL